MAKGYDSLAVHIVDANSSVNKLLWKKPDVDLVSVQCFPFYSILLAVNQTRVDFFSLDIEGHELHVLKTIPWHKVDIKVRIESEIFEYT